MDIYQGFVEIDIDRLTNTMTVQDARCIDEMPTMRALFEESKVKHPTEILLSTFKSNQYDNDDDWEESDLDLEEVQSKGIDELYKNLQSK